MPSRTASHLLASALRAWVLTMAGRDLSPLVTLERSTGKVSRQRPSCSFVLLLGSLYRPFYPAALRSDQFLSGEATPARTSPMVFNVVGVVWTTTSLNKPSHRL